MLQVAKSVMFTLPKYLAGSSVHSSNWAQKKTLSWHSVEAVDTSIPAVFWVDAHVSLCLCLEQVRKVLWTRKGVRATVVTAGHCTDAELISGHALASCCSCCVHSRGLC